VAIAIRDIVDPDGDAVTIVITRILQDEPTLGTDKDDNDEGRGSGHTDVDASGVGTSQASVRAERAGSGDGRIYEIRFTATDARGGTCLGTVLVGVPHNKKDTPVDSLVRYDSTVAGGPPLAGPAFNLPPAFANAGSQRTDAGSAVTFDVQASDSNRDTLVFSAVSGGTSTLPPGLTIDPATGRVTGTPAVPGTYHVVLTVTDPFGGSSTAAFDWTVVTPKKQKKVRVLCG
jgi:hypothetical protein